MSEAFEMDEFKRLLLGMEDAPMCVSHGCRQRTYGRKGLTQLCPMCDAIIVEMWKSQLMAPTPEMVVQLNRPLGRTRYVTHLD